MQTVSRRQPRRQGGCVRGARYDEAKEAPVPTPAHLPKRRATGCQENGTAIFDIVFEGGGAKGSAFAGALAALRENGHTTRRLVGTSAGAITAALVAAGYSPAEMLAIVNEKRNGAPRFATFMDHPRAALFTDAEKQNSDTLHALEAVHIPQVADRALLDLLLASPIYAQLFSFVECGGAFAGNAFVRWLAEKLAAKGIAANDTLATFCAKKQVDLSVVASDTTGMEMLVLNRRTAPDVPVVWAVRMSMSIPFVWREVVWQDSWGQYRGRRKTGNIIVDGGVLSNFPIRLIAGPAPGIMADAGPNGALNLGLMLDDQLAVPGVDPKPDPIGQPRVIERVARLMDTMMGARDNEDVREHASEICHLPVNGYGTIEFNMSDTKLKALVAAAHDAVVAHLKARNLIGPPAETGQ